MPRRRCAGCFNLLCILKQCPVKNNDVRELSSEEECLLENDLLDFTLEDLSRFTGQFSQENLIGCTQFGELYRGKMSAVCFDKREITKDVAVKIMVDSCWLGFNVGFDKLPRLENELKFLQHPRIRDNPNFAKVIGCCRRGDILGVVYDLNPRDTLHNFIIQDDFKWLQRVNTALTLARLLNYLHDRKSPYVIRNFDPAHIVVDQNFTPVVFEFGMLVGGVLGNTIELSERRCGTYGYIDPLVAQCGPVAWTVKSDVYAFGVVLLSLISKRVIDKKNTLKTAVYSWALKEYKPRCSLVHQSLKCDPDFDSLDGPKVTELAMQCIADTPNKRPMMKEVVKRLKALHVVQQHGMDVNHVHLM